MGWFGFNGGSALAADGIAVNAIFTTNTAAAAAALVWMVLSWLDEKPNVLGIVTGAVVGLVAITPGAGFVTPLAAIVIGGIASILSYYTIRLVKNKTNIDESLDVFACHGIGGIWGALATGIFASTAVNPGGADGLLYGNPRLLLTQAIAVGCVIVFSFVVTSVMAWLLDKTMGLRVSDTEEMIGLDISEHRERAYG
jgi:Amt family ammonium transporter